MKRTCALIVIASALALSARASAQSPPLMPVDQIRPGQTGYGLTVFRGFKIERFKVQVVGVLKNFLPKQDIILMRGDHPVLRKAGVLGGMSGSPIYIDGKLIGALAYGWRFAKEPIFGVTPIHNMLGLLKHRLRGPGQAGGLPGTVGRGSAPRVFPRPPASPLNPADWVVDPFKRVRRPLSGGATPQLAPLAIPLSVAGVAPAALPDLRRAFAAFGFEPVQGGGTGKAEGPRRFTVGSAIGVQMVKGDISMTGTGTVTWVKGNKVLGFGHSMFNAGEIYMPVVSARIHHPLASVMRSFKLSSPARVLGALVQDRQAAILADTRMRVKTIPMSVTIRSGNTKSVYNVRLAIHRLLTGSLVRTVVSSAIKEALADVAHATFDLTTRVSIKGYPQLKITEQAYSRGGLRMAGLHYSTGVRSVHRLLNNPFAPAAIQRIDVYAAARFGKLPLVIKSVRVPTNFVKAGARLPLEVTFKRFGGSAFTRRFTLDVPRSMAGTMLKVTVSGGNQARQRLPTPQNLRQYIKLLQRRYPGRAVVISLSMPTETLHLNGRTLRDLPPSVADSLRTGSLVRAERRLITTRRRVHTTQQLILGSKSIRIRVKSEVVQ